MTFHGNLIRVACAKCGRKVSKTNARAHFDACRGADREWDRGVPGYYVSRVWDEIAGGWSGARVCRIDDAGCVWFVAYYQGALSAAMRRARKRAGTLLVGETSRS